MKGRSILEILVGAVVLIVATGFLAYAVTNTGRTTRTGGLALTARFDRIDGLAPGADVRIAGVKVGTVTGQRIDPTTFLAILSLDVDSTLRIPEDSSAEITSEGLLGGKYVAIVPGGAEKLLRSGSEITITQSSVSLEALLGRFIFSVTELSGQRPATPEGAAPAVPTARP
ncbi:phospholipid/cholesterol/gamma-HCH transport system substrate-binding protein [Humitalea rosea]|uniref:Phospholipid/cholesterol/gamma-HCH transport system substrate-binding protein n=1 Tax=Humitalea rosea TaxID=990373 RepID=A0A2W7HZM6_9PROT|nr:outer membrane lipid asymmetry maintenance protein MlaD [Humitalea rosea]PZW38662.1 phospholipid/cholesterol/gamma-HCH transport system substrate-binding protein [Humitalea rosea]